MPTNIRTVKTSSYAADDEERAAAPLQDFIEPEAIEALKELTNQIVPADGEENGEQGDDVVDKENHSEQFLNDSPHDTCENPGHANEVGTGQDASPLHYGTQAITDIVKLQIRMSFMPTLAAQQTILQFLNR